MRNRRTLFIVLLSTAALLSASMLAPAFGAPKAVSAASLAKKLARTLKIAQRADRNAKRAIAGLQVEGRPGVPGAAGPQGAAGAQGPAGAKGDRGAQGLRGLQGLQGIQGEQGNQGEPATRLWAIIAGDSTTTRGSGVTSSGRVTATGAYQVVFDRDVTTCSYQATQSSVQGETLVQPRSGVPNGVYVATFTSAGAPADRAFHLAVFC